MLLQGGVNYCWNIICFITLTAYLLSAKLHHLLTLNAFNVNCFLHFTSFLMAKMSLGLVTIFNFLIPPPVRLLRSLGWWREALCTKHVPRTNSNRPIRKRGDQPTSRDPSCWCYQYDTRKHSTCCCRRRNPWWVKTYLIYCKLSKD